MTLSHEERQLVSELSSGAIDGTLTGAQQEKLEQLLRASEEARVYYVRLMEVSASLAWAARSATPGAAPASTSAWRGRWFPAAAAAAILVLALLGMWVLREKPVAIPPSLEGVAVISNAFNLEWEGSQEPLHVGNVLKPDWMRIKSGVAQIELISGASLWLEGPAVMRLDGKNEGYCAAGKVMALVPKGSGGLHLDTPLGSVTDRGTEFGIEVTAAKVTVHVFEGMVDVTPTGGVTKSYFAGQSVALFPGGGMLPGMADASVFNNMGYGWNDGYNMTWDWWSPRRFRGPVPPTWKGGNPLDYIRDQLVVDETRWKVLEPKIGAYLDAQRVAHGEGFPWDNDVANALWGLELSTMNNYSSDEELSHGLTALRQARQVAREKLDAAEQALKQELTDSEETRLVTMGYLK